MAMSKNTFDVESGSDDVKDRVCDACKTDGVIRPTIKYCLDCNQALCQYCVDSHRRIKHIKDHKLVVLSNEAVKDAHFLSTCMACPDHPDKTVELVCRDHDVMFCILCASVNHRSCRQVVDLACEATDANVVANKPDLIQKLDAATKHMKEIVKIHQKHNEVLQSQIDVGIPHWLKKLRANVLKALNRIEHSVLTNSCTQGKEEIYRATIELSMWESYIKALNDASRLLTNVEQNGSKVHAYIAVNHVQRKLAEIEEKIYCQGNQIERQSLEVKEGQALQSICEGKPTELIFQRFNTKVYPLPPCSSLGFGIQNNFPPRTGDAILQQEHDMAQLADSIIYGKSVVTPFGYVQTPIHWPRFQFKKT